MTSARRPLAAFLLAAAGLAAELAWTRVAGLIFFGDAAFLVVTLAVAGGAAGAALGAARPSLLRGAGPAIAAAAGAALLALGLAVAWALAGRGGPLATLAATAPAYAAFGLALAGVFAGAPRRAPRIYAADLLGAALGAAASVPLLGRVGAPDALLLAAAAAAGGAVALAPRRAAAAGFGGLAAVLAGVAVVPGPDLDPARLATPKEIVRTLEGGGERLEGRWGTLGRSERVRRADGAEVLYLDGGAGSLIPTPATGGLWRADLGRFAFETLSPDRVFVVGGGAGLEAVHALETGADAVLVAELNGAGADLAAASLAEAAGRGVDPFADPRVRWVRDEARTVLLASGERFDLIALSQAVTRTAEARGLALAENGLYTVEAMRDWLDALRPGGAVAFELYDELTLTRALLTVATALRESGRAVDDAAALDHLVALLDPRTSPPTPLLLAFRDAPAFERVVGLARAAEARGLALLHLPGLLTVPSLEAVADGTSDLATVAAAGDGVDLRPVTDDAPFFWSFEPGVPTPLRRLGAFAAVLAAVGGAALIAVRRAGARGDASDRDAADVGAPADAAWPAGTRRGLGSAGVLGVAFLAFELAALSRTGLLLGHPPVALAVTLAALLTGASAGAAAARRAADAWTSLARAAWAAALAVVAWTLVWPFLADAVVAAPAAARAAVAAASVAAVGVALGAPFPLLLRRLGAGGPGVVARAWALTGLGSLAAGVGATALAHVAGFEAVLLASAVLYLVAMGLVGRIPASQPSGSRASP